MTTIHCERLFSRHRARRAGFLVALIGAWTVLASAQTPPYSLFGSSTITSAGNTITATRVPVVLSGSTLYWNVTLQFDVDASGNLTLAPNYPIFTKAPTLITANFQPGNYTGPSTINSGEMYITVGGPGVNFGGATEWSLLPSIGANPYTYPNSANWYVGPIADNPNGPRIKKAGLSAATIEAYSFGSGIGPCSTQSNGAWYCVSLLLGFSQTGTILSIVSFTDDNGNDHNQPVGTVSYTLNP